MPDNIEVGDRFEDKDPRNENRVVEVREVREDGRFRVQVEVHPLNPSAVGRHSTVSAEGLLTRYRRISH